MRLTCWYPIKWRSFCNKRDVKTRDVRTTNGQGGERNIEPFFIMRNREPFPRPEVLGQE